jgi:hypothetical protein
MRRRECRYCLVERRGERIHERRGERLGKVACGKVADGCAAAA